jgi:hypothetical protein
MAAEDAAQKSVSGWPPTLSVPTTRLRSVDLGSVPSRFGQRTLASVSAWGRCRSRTRPGCSSMWPI